jgi:hypothetical protein
MWRDPLRDNETHTGLGTFQDAAHLECSLRLLGRKAPVWDLVASEGRLL